MPDHIPEFEPFMSEAEDVPMLPPSEIRRRGDRRRTVRRTSLTAGSLALALVAGIAVAQSPFLAMGPDSPNIAQPAEPTPTVSASAETSETPEPTPDPTPSMTPSDTPGDETSEAPAPTETATDTTQPSASSDPSTSAEDTTTAELPVEDPKAPSTAPSTTERSETVSAASFPDASVYAPGLAQIAVGEGLGQAAHSPCETGDFGDYTSSWQATYAYPNTDDPYAILQRVFSYPDAASAEAALVKLQGQAANCTDPYGAPLKMYDDGQAWIGESIDREKLGTDDVSLSYLEGSWAVKESEDQGVFLTLMVVRVDNRLAVVTEDMQNNEKHCSPTTSDIVDQCWVPAAVNDIAQALQR